MGKLDDIFGKIQLNAQIGDKDFAEIFLEEDEIIINITSIPYFLKAALYHTLKRERVTSNKLKALKDAGYKLIVKWGRVTHEL